MARTLLVVVAIISIELNLLGQGKVDSLIANLPNVKVDTARLNDIIAISDILSDSDPDSAIVWLKEGMSEIDRIESKAYFLRKKTREKLVAQRASIHNLIGYSLMGKSEYKQSLEQYILGKQCLESINDKKYLPTILMNIGVCHKEIGSLDSAQHYYELAGKQFIANNDSIGFMRVKGNIGVVLQRKGLHKAALEQYFDILRFAERTGHLQMAFITLNNIGYVYYNMKDKEKAIEYFEKCAETIAKTNHRTQLPILYSNLASLYFENGDYKNSALNLEKSNALYLEMGNTQELATNSYNYGLMIEKKEGFAKALPLYLNALKVAQQYNNTVTQIKILNNLASVDMLSINPEQATMYAQQALKLAKEYNTPLYLQETFKTLSKLYQAKGQYKQALEFYHQFVALSDSLLNDAKLKDIVEMETKYQTEKKQQQIDLQKEQLINKDLMLSRNRMIMVSIVSVFGLILLTMGAILFSWRKRKQHQLDIARKNESIAKQQYLSLYQQLQIKAIKEKITGQEEERRRIARELHDGIGGTLTAVRMKLEGAGNNPNPEDIASLAQMLTSTWEEVRAISHNLMPPQFSDISIDQVLQHHIRELNKSGKIQFSIQFLPTDGWENIPRDIQVEVYRIVQELCSNTLKHSNATRVELQLSRIDEFLNLTMEDNGDPFDYLHGGIGYRNIVERLHLLNGTYEKNSQGGKGNTHLVVIPIPQLTNSSYE